jgi:peptidylprolyl isomerase domain and WD repeat-containing protein 1
VYSPDLFRDKSGDRDIFNERPTREEQTIAQSATSSSHNVQSRIARRATVHTTFGDIHLTLFPDQAPKAVENFVGHARNGYFEGVLFHRVIAKFVRASGGSFCGLDCSRSGFR